MKITTNTIVDLTCGCYEIKNRYVLLCLRSEIVVVVFVLGECDLIDFCIHTNMILSHSITLYLFFQLTNNLK